MKEVAVVLLLKEFEVEGIKFEFKFMNGQIWIQGKMLYFCISGKLFPDYSNLSFQQAQKRFRNLNESAAYEIYTSAVSKQAKAKQQ